MQKVWVVQEDMARGYDSRSLHQYDWTVYDNEDDAYEGCGEALTDQAHQLIELSIKEGRITQQEIDEMDEGEREELYEEAEIEAANCGLAGVREMYQVPYRKRKAREVLWKTEDKDIFRSIVEDEVENAPRVKCNWWSVVIGTGDEVLFHDEEDAAALHEYLYPSEEDE